MMAILVASTVILHFGSSNGRADDGPNWQELVGHMRRHGMSMPPLNARLVLAHTGSHTRLGGRSAKDDPGVYSPAFLLEQRGDGTVVVLRGLEPEELRPDRRADPIWREFSSERVEPRPGGYSADFARLSTFLCAVQLAARDDSATAAVLWARFDRERRYWETIGDETIDMRETKPGEMLARCLFGNLRERVLDRPDRWKETLVRMHGLLDEAAELQTPQRLRLAADLTRAVMAKPPVADSNEALLLEWSRMPSRFDEFDPTAEPAQRLILRGYDAIPDLTALLDDERITAHEQQRMMRSGGNIHRVGELAETLLRKIVGSRGPDDRERRWNSAAWRDWWERKRTVAPEEFFVSAIFTRGEGQITAVHSGPARIVARDYPHRLGRLSEDFASQAGEWAGTSVLAQAIADSGLPKERRVALLSNLAQRGTLAQRRDVLGILAAVDGPEAARILKPLLEALPVDSDGAYWTCVEASFTRTVMRIEDDSLWRDYVGVVSRSSVGLRREMLAPLSHAYVDPQNRDRRLAFLKEFLDDASERVIPEPQGKFEGPGAACGFPRIEVRDFAAMVMGWILNSDERPDEDWSTEQWAAFRSRIRSRLEVEGLPVLTRTVGPARQE